MGINRIGILYHPMIEAARNVSEEMKVFLEGRGIAIWLCSAWEGEAARAQVEGTDLIVTTGGDGTILRAAQAAAPGQVPITGINLGNLGFMTELRAHEAKVGLTSLLEGNGWIDERAMIEASLAAADQQETTGGPFYALNDVVVARGGIARAVNIEARVNGEHLTRYKADGVIVATATGSTAYSLACGGPILHPTSGDFMLLPISPHLGLAYTMVLPSTEAVELQVNTTHQATLSVDGLINLPLPSGAVITVQHSPHTTRFLRAHPKTSFYGSLEQRLKGKQ